MLASVPPVHQPEGALTLRWCTAGTFSRRSLAEVSETCRMRRRARAQACWRWATCTASAPPRPASRATWTSHASSWQRATSSTAARQPAWRPRSPSLRRAATATRSPTATRATPAAATSPSSRRRAARAPPPPRRPGALARGAALTAGRGPGRPWQGSWHLWFCSAPCNLCLLCNTHTQLGALPTSP
jgi:hypothetical protein